MVHKMKHFQVKDAPLEGGDDCGVVEGVGEEEAVGEVRYSPRRRWGKWPWEMGAFEEEWEVEGAVEEEEVGELVSVRQSMRELESIVEAVGEGVEEFVTTFGPESEHTWLVRVHLHLHLHLQLHPGINMSDL